MTPQLLSRQSHRRKKTAQQPFLNDLALPLARVHELCGNARRTLAMIIASQMEGPVFWINPGWVAERLNPDGIMRFINPGRLTFMTARRPEDILWTMEEVLRSGAVPLVVTDIPAPPALTPVRRLHLAAETGAEEGNVKPLGLLLTPGTGGAQGVETRWHMAGAHGIAGLGWTLTRNRARTDPPKTWHVAPENGKFLLQDPPKTNPSAQPQETEQHSTVIKVQ